MGADQLLQIVQVFQTPSELVVEAVLQMIECPNLHFGFKNSIEKGNSLSKRVVPRMPAPEYLLKVLSDQSALAFSSMNSSELIRLVIPINAIQLCESDQCVVEVLMDVHLVVIRHQPEC